MRSENETKASITFDLKWVDKSLCAGSRLNSDVGSDVDSDFGAMRFELESSCNLMDVKFRTKPEQDFQC
jgi:hypothetical protein